MTSHPPEPPESQQLAIADSQPAAFSAQQSIAPQKNPWLTALIVALLLLGGFWGWRWWRGGQAAQQGGGGGFMAQAAPVTVEPVQTGTVQESSEFVGSLESRTSVTLSPNISGRISRIFVRPGDRVVAGAPLVELRQDEREAQRQSVAAGIDTARAEVDSAQSELQALQAERTAQAAEVDLQRENFRRTSGLVAEGALAQQQLDIASRNLRAAEANLTAINQRIQAAIARQQRATASLTQAQADERASAAQLQDTVVEAPFAGVVGDIPVRLGQFVNAGEAVTSVTQNQVLELELAVPIERAPELELGQRVVLSDAQGNPLDVGRISFIAPQVNAAAQSVLVKASFDNPDNKLLNGQFVRARLIWSEQTGILVPSSAIARIAGQTFVFVAERPDPAAAPPAGQPPAAPGQPPAAAPQLIARQKLVQLGSLQGNRYQVLEGLQPGEQIITSGILNLTDGVPIAPTAAAPAAGFASPAEGASPNGASENASPATPSP